MDRAVASAWAPAEGHFQDGLGERRVVVDAGHGGTTLELLCLREELSAVPSFEFALRERVSRLAAFRHAYYGRVHGVERLTDPGATLAVVSDSTPGVRLSELLAHAQQRRIAIDINAALCLIRQLVPAVAMMHEHARDVAHGALGPERLLVTPHARLAIIEYVLGAALEQLRFSHDRYWKELRIPLPRSAGAPRFDHRADVMQVGMVALSLILGRPIGDDEYPAKLGELVASTWAVSAKGGFEPLPPGLRAWLGRALQLDVHHAFASAIDARTELDRVLGDSDFIASPASLEALLARCQGAFPVLVPKAAPGPMPVPTPAPEKTSAPPLAAPQTNETDDQVPPAATLTPNRRQETASRGQETANRRQEFEVRGGRGWRVIAAAAAVVVALVLTGVVAAGKYFAAKPVPIATGTLVVTTNPAGAQVVIDGSVRGQSPVTVTLNPGSHVLELHGDGDPRSIPVTITAGAQLAQYIELPLPAAPAPEPSRSVAEAPPPVADAALQPGWLTISAPIDLQLYEQNRLLGTSTIDRIMVPAGRHEIDLVNNELNYRTTRVVQVAGGKVASIKVELPNGTIALNAVPWAAVWIDGQPVGETPIGNLTLPIGTHDVVFRHPDLGEQHYSQVVTLKGPARLSVDLRKK